MVDTNSVGSDGLHEISIAGALVAVDEGVVWSELVSNAWKVSVLSTGSRICLDLLTLDVKLVAIAGEELCSLLADGWDSSDRCDQGRRSGQSDSETHDAVVTVWRVMTCTIDPRN